MFNGYKVSVCKDETVQEIDSGDGCITMSLAALGTVHLKMDKMSNFILSIFTTIKNVSISLHFGTSP